MLLQGAVMEGSPIGALILVERFPFGWQALEVLNFRCRLEDHVVTRAERVTLMAGMPPLRTESACGRDRDRGPVADIDALRTMYDAGLVPSVAVSGDYAKLDWYGGGGGENVFRRPGSRWVRIMGGGGAFGVEDMRRAGVPQSSWCALNVYDAPCPKNAPTATR